MHFLRSVVLSVALLTAPLTLSGCASTTPAQVESTIRAATNASTIGALYALKSDPLKTAQIRDIAFGVSNITVGGSIDYDLVRQEILDQLALYFSAPEQQIIILLAGNISQLVFSYLPPAPTQSQTLSYAHAAALGVVDGCDLYATYQKDATRRSVGPRPSYLDRLHVKPHPELKP